MLRHRQSIAIIGLMVLLSPTIAWAPVADGEFLRRIADAQDAALANMDRGAGRVFCKYSIEFKKTHPDCPRPSEKRSEAFFVDFKFKGMLHRREQYNVDQETKGKGELVRIDIDAVEKRMGYMPLQKLAFISTREEAGADKQFGAHFRPYAFNTLDGMPFQELLRRLDDPKYSVVVDTTGDGLLRLEAHTPGSSGKSVYLLRPEAGYLVTDCYSESPAAEVTIKVDWQENARGWYPKAMTFEFKRFYSSEEARTTRDYIQRWDMDFEEFDATSEIDDADFAFESMDVPVGTLVRDGVIELSYTLGSTEDLENALGTLVTEPKDLSSLDLKHGDPKVVEVPDDGVAETPTGTASEAEPRPRQVDQPNRAWLKAAAMFAVAFIAVAAAIFLVVRLRKTRP